MTIEEARKVLDGERLAITLEYSVSSETQKKRLNEKFAALNVAIEAIDKRIPKEPICIDDGRKRTIRMNENQKEFLKELKTLCDKYRIDTIAGQDNYIGIGSNGELLLFRTYVDGKFSGIMISVNDYEVEE